jgi:hypothetical protein
MTEAPRPHRTYPHKGINLRGVFGFPILFR